MTTIEKMAEVLKRLCKASTHETRLNYYSPLPESNPWDDADEALQAYEAEKTLLEKTQEHHDHGMVAPSCVGCPTAEAVVENDEFVRVRLENAVQAVLHKPQSYHYICYGGGTVKMVDLIDVVPERQCRYQGDKNWLTPQCEGCTGIIGSLELEMWERHQNAGIKRLAAYLTAEEQ